MTAAATYTLICDDLDCTRTIATMEARREHARTVAASKGWAVGKARDLCPKHAKAATRGR